MFFVRRATGFLPVCFEGGSVITPDDVQKEPFKPSLEQLDRLTVKQVVSFFASMGFRLKKGTDKERFLKFALKEWDETVAHGLTITRNYDAKAVGVPKMVMFKRENSYYMPFTVRSGQVFYEKFFDELECEQLTVGMLNRLTVVELLDLHSALGNGGLYVKADGKKLIAERLLSFWNANLERFNDNKAEENDTNSITMMPEDELSDASSDISADEFVMNSMYDYLGLDEEKVSNEMRFYIQSAADFYDKPVNVEVCSGKGDKLLMSVVVDEDKFTVDDIKDEIINRINHFSEDENRLTADDFVLSDGVQVLTGAHRHQPHQTRLYMFLRLKGGGINIMKKKKAQQTRDEKINGIKGRFVAVNPSIQDAKEGMTFAHYLLNSTANDMMTNEINKFSMDKCKELMAMWDEGQTSGDRFIRQVAPSFMSIFDRLQTQHTELETVMEAMLTAFEVAFAREYMGEGGRYTLTPFRDALMSRINALQCEAEVSRRVNEALNSKGAGKGSAKGSEDAPMSG